METFCRVGKKILVTLFCKTGLFFIPTESEAILLYVKKATVTGISLDPSITKEQIIPVRQLKTAVGVAFSVEDKYVFWSDITADAISRVFLNGSSRETVVSDGKQFSVLHIIIISISVRFNEESKFCHSLFVVEKKRTVRYVFSCFYRVMETRV